MDHQAATAWQLMQLFEKIQEQRSLLVAENDEMNGDLVLELTAVMFGIMKRIVSLINGTNLATGSQTETSLSAENTGTSVALLQETNNQAGITGPSSLLESSQLLARSPAKESWLAKTAGLFDVVIQEYNTPSILIGPGAPVRATTMRERTPLGLFRVIMMANTSFLADMITKLSSMLDRDSRKNLASTSSAMNNLVHRNINLKRLAAQDQEITSKKKAKMAKTARKGALKDQKRSKKARVIDN